MKKFILGIVLVLTTIAATAQDTLTYTSGIRVHFSGAYPVGDFSSSDFEDTFAPFAFSGALYQISYSREIKPYLFAGTSLGLRRNPMDLDEFASDSDELVLSKTSEPWQSVFTLADVEYRYTTFNGYLFVKGSVGAAFNRSASLHVETTYGPIDQAADNSTSFAYGASTGFLINLKKFGLGFETGILSTKPEFKFTDAQGKSTNYNLSMTTINVGIFGAYNF
jgi:hypothetical protein